MDIIEDLKKMEKGKALINNIDVKGMKPLKGMKDMKLNMQVQKMKDMLKFYDLKKKKKFTSNKYKMMSKKMKSGRMMHYAMCTSPSGSKSTVIVGKDTYMKNK